MSLSLISFGLQYILGTNSAQQTPPRLRKAGAKPESKQKYRSKAERTVWYIQYTTSRIYQKVGFATLHESEFEFLSLRCLREIGPFKRIEER